MKTFTLHDFLTDAQIEQAAACRSAAEIDAKVITPNLAAINKKLGQDNGARYLAYACECAFRQTGVWA